MRELFITASLLLGQALGQAEPPPRLDQYTLAKGPVVIGGVSQNASGLTYHAGRDSLFVVLDSPQRVVELGLDGSLKRKINLNKFEDTEGIVWMQGESDVAESKEVAEAYEANLKQLMTLIRAALRDDDLPVVIGKITDSGMDETDGKRMDYHGIVQKAQKSFVDNDVCAAFVTTLDNEKHIADGWHYTSEGYVHLGEAFAEAMMKLQQNCDKSVI